MSNNLNRHALPPIPYPTHSTWQWGKQTDWFTAEQMRDYAMRAINAIYEEAEQSLSDVVDVMLKSEAPKD